MTVHRIYTINSYSFVKFQYDNIPVPSVQWMNSWWWTEELPKTCTVSCRSNFGKFYYKEINQLSSAHMHCDISDFSFNVSLIFIPFHQSIKRSNRPVRYRISHITFYHILIHKFITYTGIKVMYWNLWFSSIYLSPQWRGAVN